MPQAGGEGQQSLRDAGHQAGHRVRAVLFERELALEGVKDRFDPLTDGAEAAEAGLFAFAVGAQEDRAKLAPSALRTRRRRSPCRRSRCTRQVDAGEHLGGDVALRGVGGGELERDRHAVAGAQQVQPEAPEVAAMAGAVAIGGVAGELRAFDRLARLPHGTGVESSSLMLSHHDGEVNAIALSSLTICGASARIRLL